MEMLLCVKHEFKNTDSPELQIWVSPEENQAQTTTGVCVMQIMQTNGVCVQLMESHMIRSVSPGSDITHCHSKTIQTVFVKYSISVEFYEKQTLSESYVNSKYYTSWWFTLLINFFLQKAKFSEKYSVFLFLLRYR